MDLDLILTSQHKFPILGAFVCFDTFNTSRCVSIVAIGHDYVGDSFTTKMKGDHDFSYDLTATDNKMGKS